MPVKSVSVNEEVHARRPNTCQWRAAKVLEDANQNHHRVVKLKFIGDTAVHNIPWAHIKLFQYVKRDVLFRRTLPSRPPTRSSQKVISIDLTDLEHHEGASPQQIKNTRVNGRCSKTGQAEGETDPAMQLDYSSSVTSDHATKPASLKRKPLSTDPCLASTSDLNAPLSLSDHDTAVQTASPSDDADTPQTSAEYVSTRMANSDKHTKSSSGNAIESPVKEVSRMYPIRRRTRRFSLEKNTVPPKKIKNNEIIWDARPPRWEDELRKDLEKPTTLNTKTGSLLMRRRSTANGAVAIPRERHPHRALGDIPIPRARPQLNGSLDSEYELNDEMCNLATGLTPSKRRRSSNDILYKDSMATNLSKFSSNGLRRRMRKKARRSCAEHDPSVSDVQRSTERLLEVVSKSETNTLERFKSTARFPFVSESEELEDDVDKLINNGCDEMVDQHKNEVQAMLQSFGDLDMKKKPLPVRIQGSRRKSAPKRWTDRKVTERTVFQLGTGGPFFPRKKENLGEGDDIPSGLFNSSVQDSGSVNHEVRCGCQSPNSRRRNELVGKATIQCGLCGYWSHLECTGLARKAVEDIRGASSATKKHFACAFCLDEATYRSLNHATTRALGKSSRRAQPAGSANNRSDLGEDREWYSEISPVVQAGSQTKKYNSRSSRRLPKSTIPSSRCRYRPRSPLSEAEIQARNENVEFLRSGVLKPSVGLKERELIDSKTPNFSL